MCWPCGNPRSLVGIISMGEVHSQTIRQSGGPPNLARLPIRSLTECLQCVTPINTGLAARAVGAEREAEEAEVGIPTGDRVPVREVGIAPSLLMRSIPPCRSALKNWDTLSCSRL